MGTGSVVRLTRWAIGLCSIVAFMAAAPSANATISNVFSNTPTPIPCTVQSGTNFRLCDQTTFVPAQPRSTVKTFDGVPLDVRVAFPPAPASGPDGPYPLIMLFHGYAGAKLTLANMTPFLNAGYATFSVTTRGFNQSCGTSAARSADPAGCANGYVRLMDTRYEVRDSQELAGLLADEGRTSYTQIGAIGGSYGGGMSMALAALKDRKMLPDGSLVPWQSPGGTPMQIAAATPEIPWTDLPYSLLPNGRTLDYVSDAPYQGRTGVLKQSWENALYNSGLSGFYAPAGLDPDADLMNWHSLFNAGEPYDDSSGNPLAGPADIRDELTTHHSSYYIDHSQAPAPLLISSGFTDDLFPADETLRFYNRTRTQYPSADISLFYASLGHQRGQNKGADLGLRSAAELAWLNYYVKGVGSVPFHGVETLTQTCPSSAASGGPFFAGSWAQIAPGEIRFTSAAPQTILPTAGSSTISNTFDPFGSGSAGACAVASATDQADLANYRMDPVPAGQSFTLMGATTVIADITSPSSDSQIAARLLDVNPSTNQETLVARGLWRPAITSTPQRQVFQLHPNGYRFVAGHVVKLELLPKDTPYGRTSNNQQNVTVENLEMRLPVVDSPGSVGGLVTNPAAKVVPPGYQLSPDYLGRIVVVKDAQPDDPQDFNFTAGGGLSPASFDLDDDPGDGTLSNTQTFEGVPSGTGYSVTENVPGGWNQLSATCDDGSSPSNISVSPGETVTCTFTNQKHLFEQPSTASPISASLVPVFSQCTSGANAEHAAPLSGPACEPPAPTSSAARVGATGVGSAQLSAAPGDLAIVVTDSDIQTPAGEDYDPSPSGTADLAEVSRLRITDIGHCSTSGCTGPYDQPGTSTDLDFGPVPIECLPNGDPLTAPGSDCNVTTSANSVTPGAIAAGRQTVLQVFRVKINDANGDLFQQQGIYEP